MPDRTAEPASGRFRAANRADWDQCSAVTRQHGRTFYFASALLAPDKRRAMHAAYAYCRIADDLVDRAAELGPDSIRAQLDTWEVELGAPVHPVAVAFAHTRHTYSIPSEPAHELFAGIRMDLEPAHYSTWDDLRTYCYRVAGTIGLISAPILGCVSPAACERAVDLGIAMQLTNILRDVGEDARMGRMYLPTSELAQFGIDPESVLAGRPDGDFHGLMRFQIARARELYSRADVGIAELDFSGQFTTLASSRLYGRILDRIEDLEYDVFSHRAAVSTTRKVREMPSVLGAFLRLRRIR